MSVVQARLHSDLRREGQIYQVSDEVEQDLEIFKNGKVCLHAISHEGYPCWEEEKEIEEDKAIYILNLLEKFMENPEVKEVDHVGKWKLHVTYENGEEKEATGSMVGGVVVEDVDLTDWIRENMPFMSLGAFDQTDSL